MPMPLGGGIVNPNSKFPLLPSVQEIGNARVKGDIERVFNDASVFEGLVPKECPIQLTWKASIL